MFIPAGSSFNRFSPVTATRRRRVKNYTARPWIDPDALSRTALAVSAAEGSGVFEQLASELAEILGVDVGFIAVYDDPARTQMRMLAFSLDGRAARAVQLPARRHAVRAGGRARVPVRARRARARSFPTATCSAGSALESYAAYPLNDAAGGRSA